MRTLGLIPARGGSKGVVRKNIRPIHGVPLLVYTVRAAQEARLLDHVILSTEDEEIAAVGREAGVDVPFLRPSELAQDDTPTLPVVFHALQTLREQGHEYDCLVLLQPTTPLRTSEDIDKSIQMLQTDETDSVVSVCPVPGHFHPEWQLVQEKKYLMGYNGNALSQLPPRRQALSTTYTRNGAIYAIWLKSLYQQQTLLGEKTRAYLMPLERSVNIDSLVDLQMAELLVKKL